MKQLFLLFCAAFPLLVSGQDYQPVASDHIRFFDRGEYGGYDEYGLKIDSVLFENGDSLFYNYLATRDLRGDPWGECRYKRYSWIGSPVIVKGNGWTYFINQDQDSIKINHQALAGETWPALQISSDSIIWATVTDIGSQNILGLTDNVKTISFSLRNADGQILSHYVNGSSIVIGETLGLVQGMDLYHFPDYIEEEFLGSFYLTGVDELGLGIRRAGTETLFEDLEVGDEFGYTVRTNDHQTPYPNPAQKFNYLLRVIAKTPQPSVEYTVVTYTQSTFWAPDTSQPFPSYQQVTTYSSDTTLHNDLGFFLFYDTLVGQKMPGEMFANSGPLENFSTTDGFNTDYRINNDTAAFSHFSTEFGDVQDNGCISDNFFEFMPWNIRYVEHLGFVYATTANAYEDTQLYLTYLKRRDSIYGDPVTVSEILATEEHSAKDRSPIYPNPVRPGESINLGSSYQQIELFDMSRRSILIEHNRERLQTEDLKAGMYILRLTGPEGISTQRLVVADP